MHDLHPGGPGGGDAGDPGSGASRRRPPRPAPAGPSARPTTPFCTSEVTMAVWAGATRAARSSGMRPTLSDAPSGDRVGYLTHRQVRDGAHAMTTAPDWELPKIVSVDDHVVEPPHVWETLAARASSGTAAPKVERRGIGAHEAHRRRRTTSRPSTDDGPPGRLLGLRGPRLHPQAPRRRGRLRPRRHDDVADHLRRDAPGLLRPEGPRSRTWTLNHVEASLCFPTFPRFCGQTFTRGQGPRARAWRACRPTTTGWSRSGAATPTAASSR